MKRVNKMPTEGQFVMMWRYIDLIWCDTFRIADGMLLQYGSHIDDWGKVDSFVGTPGISEVEYYVLD